MMLDDELTARIGFVLRQAQHKLRILSDDALRPFGLTTPQFSVLKALAVRGDMSGASLARTSLLTPQTVHAILLNLEGRGLIERMPSGTDGRTMRVKLSAEGAGLICKVDPIVAGAEATLTEQLDQAQTESLRKLLLACVRPAEV